MTGGATRGRRAATALVFALLGVTAAVRPATSATPEDLADVHHGVALDDLSHPTAVAAFHWLADRAHRERLELGTVLSLSFAGLHDGALDVDVVERSPAFTDAYPTPSDPFPGQGPRPAWHAAGGLGLTRLRLTTRDTLAGPHIVGAAVRERRALSDMDLRLIMSIGDTVVRLEDVRSGFRRIWPLGVGAIDAIRLPGALSSLTPTTEYGRLDKRGSWEIMRFPKHFQDKPYLPLHIPYVRNDQLVWRPTWIAFHIWQPPRFARGFLSHGCIRMRDEDLAELSAFVFGVETFIPVRIRARPDPEMAHPHWKLKDRYWKLRNIGTASTPKYWIVNGVWVTEYAPRSPVPDGESIEGITIDSPKVIAGWAPGFPPQRRPEPSPPEALDADAEPDDGGAGEGGGGLDDARPSDDAP